MHRPSRFVHLMPVCLLSGAILLFAQDWKAKTDLPGVDFGTLAPAKKATALKLLRNRDCACGCGMKVAQCRVEDPGCAYSKGLAAEMVTAIKEGKSETAALAAAENSKWAHVPEPKLLDDPVAIPTAGAPVTGPADARITLVEFSDFQCPYCVKAIHQLDAVLKAYPKQVKLIFKQYPLESHPQASISAAAALSAHQQGKFWQMHDALFANRERLSRRTILELAGGLGLDMKKFTADLDSPETKKTVARDVADGDKAGVEGTPTVFINGQRYNGSLELPAIKKVLDDKLK
ncbi:MAG TPA: thioredoxin domain-containing protein [Bryobacteraceae bacterium]|nr:thioredoxin domain-containing protein [Bryobacteraceae bacterium]